MYVITYIHTHARTQVRTYVFMYARTHVRIYVRTCMHAYVRTYIRTYTHSSTHPTIHGERNLCPRVRQLNCVSFANNINNIRFRSSGIRNGYIDNIITFTYYRKSSTIMYIQSMLFTIAGSPNVCYYYCFNLIIYKKHIASVLLFLVLFSERSSLPAFTLPTIIIFDL